MIDGMGRSIDYLRISITDRCNLRCVYCMPEGGVQSFAHGDILSYEEIERVVRVMTQLGIKHLRLTGGEPLARLGCLSCIRRLRALPGIETIALTTNAILLDGQVEQAVEAGLTALNISLDTLDPDIYRRMTRGGDVKKVLAVMDRALELGVNVKINAVPVGGMNEAGLVDLARLAQTRPLAVRFIELMPVGCGAGLTPIPSDEILKRMESAFGPLTDDPLRRGFGPARYVKPAGFVGALGVISPMSHEFCELCNRVRLTADGYLKLCLNHTAGLDVRALLRAGAEDEALLAQIQSAIAHKPRRHAFLEEISDREERRMNEIGG